MLSFSFDSIDCYILNPIFQSCFWLTTLGLTSSPHCLSYLSFRLLGSALPLLSLAQLKEVLSGEAMTLYGEHVVSAQVSLVHGAHQVTLFNREDLRQLWHRLT